MIPPNSFINEETSKDVQNYSVKNLIYRFIVPTVQDSHLHCCGQETFALLSVFCKYLFLLSYKIV